MNPIPASKQRCLDRYQLCPQTRAQPVVLSQPEWLRARAPLERTLSIASEELDQLYALVQLFAGDRQRPLQRRAGAQPLGLAEHYRLRPGLRAQLVAIETALLRGRDRVHVGLRRR
eukprot:TRINITY_DN32256_c0_g1_i1.p1 TRINITY_DN32256_c0_g1~~TRINITY_DN32256_c0_g1_i1.p1  ORF type:complete len:116 (+),score=6.94 TRINITY_DN32256_c0_g1_i1:200-547(+)